MDLLGLAMRMAVVESELRLAHEASVAQACALLAEQCRLVLGTYTYGWPPLQPTTIARKATGDSPLLETGELRASIEWNADERQGYVGSDNPKMVWHEWGTSRVPPRPVLGPSIEAARPAVEKMFGKIAAAVASGDLAELKHLLHLLKHLAKDAKEAVEEVMGRDEHDDNRRRR